jgi:sec-independent protein translocase protein TatA
MNLGPTEILIILVIALIVFGPRKLPELGKSLGQAIGQFRRASDDFKRSWEQEVELEKSRKSESFITASTDHYSSPEDTSWNESSSETASATESEMSEATTETASAPETVAATAAPAPEKPRSEHWI